MAGVILGWSPGRGDRWDYRAAVEQVAESGRSLDRWTIDHHLDILPETDVWLLLQGSSDAGTGLIGHGIVMSESYQAVRPGKPEAAGWHVSIAFDALLPLGEQIRPDTLCGAVPGIPWGTAMSLPSLSVPLSAEPGLRQLWREQGPAATGRAQLVPGTCPPEAVTRIEVNRYERDADARRVCLAFHGTSCAACGFSFEASYGEAGTDAVEVHHAVPPAMLGSGYQLDPVADLVPLCPNCHAMAHHGVSSPRTVSELRNIISAAGHMRGEVVGNLSLEAQEDARRILEGPEA
ncbi:HNH endonuclease [Arthrobacter sp. W4I7]|uniref:HNH endonuclease n=1 Tax=Arthrobacter sp. W4I7 TaxID=3042296 RepID=UPI00277E836D|nr:HNH endonuclease [Arthrobacter sp. W4I7]MDQ0690732.1 5-methylcytosine-specific restriction protein A [Arthrobacter sp. W4I7]